MTTRHPLRLLAVILTALALLAAACGDDSSDADVGDDLNADLGELPTDEELPPAAGTCLEGTVDCNDTPIDPDGPQLEPGDTPAPEEPTDLPGSSSGMLVDGGLTVEDALTRGPGDGIIAVGGALYQDDTGLYLCGVLAESFPPQCGEDSRLPIEGFDFETLGVPLNSAQGISWTDSTISVLGTVDGGVLTIDPTVAG